MPDPTPLDLEIRKRIYTRILERPGTYLRELQRDLGLAMGHLEFHLDILERHRLITVLHGENKRFFPSEMDRNDKRLLAVLRQALPRHLLIRLLAVGESTPSRLAADLGVRASSLSYHLGKLAKAGLLERHKRGREQVYRIPDPDAALRLLEAHRSTFFDALVDAFLEGIDRL